MLALHAHARRARVTLALIAATLVLAACSGGGDNEPTGPTGDIASVTVTLPSNSVVAGSGVNAAAVAKDASGKTVTASFAWTSSNTNVATVNGSGRVTAHSAGSTTISAEAGGKSATVDVSVEPQNLNSMVEGVRAQAGVPAMAAAIVTGKGLVAIGVAGTRQTGGAGGTVGLNEKWHIGSNLKAITAALAAVAVTEGKISWSTTVEEAFPEHAATMKAQYKAVKLEDLLANRAGIRNDPPGAAYSGATARQQRESLVAWALNANPIGPVGGYFYSNMSFVIAGAMIERALGGDYEALVASKLGQPLGVTTLGWGPVPAGNPIAHYRAANSWIPCAAANCDNPPGLSAAGRAHISIGDWAKIISELLRADAGRSELISAANGRKLFTGLTPVPSSSDQYALGWMMTTRPWANGRTASHDGSNTMNHSVAWLGLGPEVAFLATTNAGDAEGGSSWMALDNVIVAMLNNHF